MEKHDHNHEQHSTKNIRVAFFLNLGFTVLEIIGGLYTNSLAILSDALHDLGDSFSLGIAWYFQKKASQGRDQKYTYGYRRFSVIGAIINSFILIVGSVIIISEAIPRIIHPQEADAKGMILLAIVGVLVNGAAVLRLKKGISINERVVMLHLMEDVLGWIAVLIGSIVIYYTDYYVIDAYLSMGIGLYVLFNVYKNMKSAFEIVLQRVPSNVNSEKLGSYLLSLKEVKSFHDLHIWSLDGIKNVMTVHLVLREDLSASKREQFLEELKAGLVGYHIDHSTVELDCNIREEHDIFDKQDDL